MTERRYRLPHPSEMDPDSYVSPPPKDSDGEAVRRSLAVQRHGGLTALSIGEALAAMYDDESAWTDTWRRRFPASAAVVDGVHQGEAAAMAVDEDDERYTDDGE